VLACKPGARPATKVGLHTSKRAWFTGDDLANASPLLKGIQPKRRWPVCTLTKLPLPKLPSGYGPIGLLYLLSVHRFQRLFGCQQWSHGTEAELCANDNYALIPQARTGSAGACCLPICPTARRSQFDTERLPCHLAPPGGRRYRRRTLPMITMRRPLVVHSRR
jgi:hypothetical protein